MTTYDPDKIWIETHYLKGLILSFQKILKFLTLKSYGCVQRLLCTLHSIDVRTVAYIL